MFERTTLPDGPRVISARLPGARSLSVAAYVLAGSRMESPEQCGAAHFMEHLTFKGTDAYPTERLLSEAIEGVGGTNNAATDRESTVYWTRLPVREAERAVDVLGELIVRPRLSDAEIDHEREVIIEEIRSYRDDAAQYVYTVFDEIFFGDTSLGREIAGDEASVRVLPADAIRDFWQASYRPANIVIAVAGDIAHESVMDLVARSFGRGNGPVPGWTPAPRPLPAGERMRIVERAGEQAHICLGVEALRRDHPDAWTLELLSAVLGQGSSSRLFLSVRGDAGLAYDVHAFTSDHADCGTMQIYAGVDPDNLGAAVEAVLRELARLRDEPVPAAELTKTRNYVRGGLELRLEESRHLASWIGVQEALHDRVLSLDEAIEALEAVTAEQIQALAGQLFRDEKLAMAVIAPHGHAAGLDAALHLP
jgi:predicted Zn-dependent peptidase